MRTNFFAIAAMTVLLAGVSCSKDDSYSGKSYDVGELYQSGNVIGIVCKTTDNGHHGVIVSLDEAKLAWAVSDGVEMRIKRNTKDGIENMNAVRKIENWTALYPAFKWCDDHNAKGESGWYMPAYEELYALYVAFNGGKGKATQQARDAFNAYLTKNGGVPISADRYLSSSQYLEDGDAYCLDFRSDGYADKENVSKGTKTYVRAICKF